VIAARRTVDARRAAEFRQGDDEGGVELAAIVQVLDQCGERLIGRGQQIVFQASEVIFVAVPVRCLSVADLIVDVDKSDAGVGKPACQEQALPQAIATVAVAGGSVFLGKIKRPAHTFGTEQVKGPLLECRHWAALPCLSIHEREKRPAIVQAGERQVRGQLQLADAEVGSVWVARDLERVVCGAQKPAF